MRILFLDQYGDLGGAQRCMLDLMPAVIAQQWTPFAACPDGPLMERLRGLGVTCSSLECGEYGMGAKSLGDVIRYAARLPVLRHAIGRLLKQNRIDLLFVNGPRLLPPAAFSRVPLLFHCHNRLSGAALWLAGRSLQYADASVVSSSRYTVEPLKRYVDPSRIRVVYNGTAAPSEPCAPHNDGVPRLGVVGRIDSNKGQDVFLKAARILKNKCRFVICGAPLFPDPAAREYEVRLRELAVGLPVEFTGYREDAVRILASLDLLVVPSLVAEATTRVILEAFAHSVPVVAFATGGIPEVIEHGVNGFLVKDRTPEALAAALDHALGDHPRLRRVSESAHDSWQARFRLERYQDEMVATMRLST